MMRIGLVASLVSPIRDAAANGPHTVIADLATGLAARGHDVTVYAAAGSRRLGSRLVEIEVAREAAAAAVQVGRTPPGSSVRALNGAFAALFERIRADAPDVTSQHAFDAAAIELAEGMPVLHTLHLPPLSDDVVRAARATREPMVTVSYAARASWQRAGVPNVGVVRNGVSGTEPAPGPLLPIALIAGRISPEKGTDAAIRVARRAGLAPLVVGDAYDQAYFAERVEPMLRPGEWIGPVSREVVLQLMARSAVLVMPVGWDEPFGLVAAEAQVMGCPVVAYRRGALPEVVTHGVGGWLVEPGDEAALVEAVAATQRIDRDVIRRRATSMFGVERMVDAYERVLIAVAAGRSAHAA